MVNGTKKAAQFELDPEYKFFMEQGVGQPLARKMGKEKGVAMENLSRTGMVGSPVSSYLLSEIGKNYEDIYGKEAGKMALGQAGAKRAEAQATTAFERQKEMMDKQFQQTKDLIQFQLDKQGSMQQEGFMQNLLGMGLGAIASPITSLLSGATSSGLQSLLGIKPSDEYSDALSALMSGKGTGEGMKELMKPSVWGSMSGNQFSPMQLMMLQMMTKGSMGGIQ